MLSGCLFRSGANDNGVLVASTYLLLLLVLGIAVVRDCLCSEGSLAMLRRVVLRTT